MRTLVWLLFSVMLAAAAPATATAEPVALPANTDVDYQLGGVADPAANVGIVVRDRSEEPVAGLYNICYVNGFQTQPNERGFWRRHRGLLLRDADGPVMDEAWGEQLLDIRTPRTRARLARIVDRWIAGCAADGFQAVEFDNLDSYSRSHGLITPRQATRFARLLVESAHDHVLAAGQKNRAGWDGTRIGFDFVVAESCGRYDECGRYVRHFGDRVLAIEYSKRDFTTTCSAYGDRLAVVQRDRNLTPGGVRRWC